ncbi:MAG: SAM-dependent methyltransferase [Gammaproteobacteria bacterium]|nr:MAG: SAM-dependent methyltransferase [Gammaproteobacteria bacterium]
MIDQLDAEPLPRPSAEALAHSDQMRTRILEAIEARGGTIRFQEFMDLVLYAPGLGYYSAGAAKFGPAGDFVTAPEISDIFAECLATGFARVLKTTRGDIVELGAGSGSLAAGLLRALQARDVLPGRYRIVEVSADLRERQRRFIAENAPAMINRVEWLDAPPAVIDGVIIANEVLDALPVERFRVTDTNGEYLGVSSRDRDLHWTSLPADERLLRQLDLIAEALGSRLPVGYVSEWCPRLPPLVADLSSRLRRGLLMFVDYGLPRRQLYHPQRDRGSLICHYRHRAHTDPFLYPGLQDISTWVDFTSVAESAAGVGLILDGFTTQAHFLIDAGLPEPQARAGSDPRSRMELSRQVGVLTLPGEMGERFKVMAFSRDWEGRLPGLTGTDLSGSL